MPGLLTGRASEVPTTRQGPTMGASKIASSCSISLDSRAAAQAANGCLARGA